VDFSRRKLKKIEAAAAALTLGDAPLARGGSWNRDGVIVFAPDSAVRYSRYLLGGTPALSQNSMSRDVN